MRPSHAGFAAIFIIVGLAIFGVFASMSVREYRLPETRALEDAAGPRWPQIPPGLRRSTKIHSGDVLAVRVAGEDDLTGEFRVDDSGAIQLPMAGRVTVAGLDVGGASEKVTAAFADGFLMQPEVAVAIQSSEYHFVFVIGLVSGGVISAQGDLTLGRVLTLAGSETAAAGRSALVVRPASSRASEPTRIDDATSRAFTFDIDRDAGVPLEDGDTIFIRPAGLIGIMGGVQNPGLYVLEPDLTVTMAITRAGGLREHATTRGLRISRFVNGTRRTIDAEMSTVLTPGDVVTVRGRRLFF